MLEVWRPVAGTAVATGAPRGVSTLPRTAARVPDTLIKGKSEKCIRPLFRICLVGTPHLPRFTPPPKQPVGAVSSLRASAYSVRYVTMPRNMFKPRLLMDCMTDL